MTAQRSDTQVIADARKREAVTVSLKRFVRRTCPRKSMREAAIERAATMPLDQMGRR